ncbi:MAG: hypothetical protein DRI73_11045 [Bacteroidetes bacterium]|nr:MAG: hypothetical protein DRI73_11045 [Bacteroidota bacterium]
MIFIITGSRGVGKTTILLKLIEELKKNGTHSSGIMTPAVYNEENNKVGFYALNVANDEQWELGRSDKLLSGPSYGPFSFNEKGFTKANEILEHVLISGSGDVFLDEIGPLELSKRYGFFPNLSLIRSFDIHRNLYLVIRRSLIDQFVSKYLAGKDHTIIEITMQNRGKTVLYNK